ncbi:MAG TPA: hypothetical protein DDW50_10925 [Firmicutes bacterium]|nr:hypothetical protein [Bacillota bacterium]
MDMRNEAIRINMYYQSFTNFPNANIPPTFKNIMIRDVKGKNAEIAVEMRGLPEIPLHNIVLENI